jgi:hypothetical protein
MRAEATCRECGCTFLPAHRAGRFSGQGSPGRKRALADAQFCSARCRQANYRWRKRAVQEAQQHAKPLGKHYPQFSRNTAFSEPDVARQS